MDRQYDLIQLLSPEHIDNDTFMRSANHFPKTETYNNRFFRVGYASISSIRRSSLMDNNKS